MSKKKPAASKAAIDIKQLRGRVYCLTQTQQWFGADEFKVSLRLLGAKVVPALNEKVTHLVTADGSLNKTTQKKVDGLTKKGAAIEVVGADELYEHDSLSPALVGAMLQGTDEDRALLYKVVDAYRYDHARLEIGAKDLTGLVWSPSKFSILAVHDVDLRKADVSGALFHEVKRSNFDGARLEKSTLSDAADCTFNSANMRGARVRGQCSGAIFDGADLSQSTLDFRAGSASQGGPPSLRGIQLDGAKIKGIGWEGVDFSECSAAGSLWEKLKARWINLAGSDLSDATFTAVDFQNADLTGAMLKGARLNEVDLRKANLKGADFTGATLVDVKLDAKLKKASVKGLEDALAGAPKAGAALAALDAAVTPAKKVEIELLLQANPKETGTPDPTLKNSKIDISLDNRDYGQMIHSYSFTPGRGDIVNEHTDTFSEGFMRCVMFHVGARVCFETIVVKASKSPTPGPEIRELTIAALAEAFDQAPPAEAELKKLTKAYRAELKANKDAELAQRRKERAKSDKQQLAAHEKAVTAERAARPQPAKKVKDMETFVEALEVRADAGRVKNAKKMLKASGFQLFHDASKPGQVLGVIKSQTDDKLVYACKLDAKGKFTCCTQNLRPCGGLRGALCKHQLVMLLGLVQAGELNAKKTDAWVEKSLDEEPALDKEEMSEVFLKYKGAEAGEIDWRPTETLPEDFYAF